MKLSHTIQKAIFNEGDSTWTLTVENGATGDVFDHVVDVYVPANGVLRWDFQDSSFNAKD